ncbi:hypothetical protein ACJX0J_035175, partial [Zea mays]
LSQNNCPGKHLLYTADCIITKLIFAIPNASVLSNKNLHAVHPKEKLNVLLMLRNAQHLYFEFGYFFLCFISKRSQNLIKKQAENI